MQTSDNAPLISNNNNLINTDSNQDENANLENDHIKVGSQEKILHLQRGIHSNSRKCSNTIYINRSFSNRDFILICYGNLL